MHKLMKQWLLLLALSLLFSTANAITVSEAVETIEQKALAYEAGELNYLQLEVFVNTAREQIYDSLNKRVEEKLEEEEFIKVRGWSEQEVRTALGEPSGMEKWVWVENQRKTMLLKNPMPRWEKVVFSGGKIKITLNAWPHVAIYGKEMYKFYWVDFELRFKRKEEAIDIEAIISDLKASISNKQELVKKSVQFERTLGRYLEERKEECDSVLSGLLGTALGQEERIEWRGLLLESEQALAELVGEEFIDEHWHGFNLRIEGEFRSKEKTETVQEIAGETDREKLFVQDAKALEQMLEQAVIAAKNSSSVNDLTNANFRMEVLSNVLSEKANREDDSYTVEEFYSFLEGLFNNYTTSFKRENIKETKYGLRLLEEKETRTEKHCQHEEKWCDSGFVCKNSNECINALGGNENCNNKIDDDGDGIIDCEDPDCIEFKDCHRACEPKCKESCWPCNEQYCKQECNACGKCNEANPDNPRDCETQCSACGNCTQQYCVENCNVCWECENEIYGDGCYSKCKDCDKCWKENRGNEVCNPLCVECSGCRFDAGSFKCFQNQQFNRQTGNCECISGYNSCDNVWENGCETVGNCGGEQMPEPAPVCGDGSCNASENSENCQQDCAAAPVIPTEECGNGTCGQGETCDNCWQDCGKCQAVCGNANCEGDETSTCPSDCGCSSSRLNACTDSETCVSAGGVWCDNACNPAGFVCAVCGNGSCEERETCKNCQQDCGECESAQAQSIEKKPIFNLITGWTILESIEFEEEEPGGREKANPEESCVNFTCPPNQYCNAENGWCECTKGWFDCDGDWLNGCESQKQCKQCNADSDCALTRCSEDRQRIDMFKCKAGGSWEEEKRIVELGGRCGTKSSGEKVWGIWIDARGEGFEDFHLLKEQLHKSLGDDEWCKSELEFAIKERQELESSLNQEFVGWFFEKFVKQNPREFEFQEEMIWAVFESFQRNAEQTARALSCLDRTDWPSGVKPVKISFNSPNGKIEFWEEFKTTSFFEKENQTVLTPYMKLWIFPNREKFKKLFKEKTMEQIEEGKFGPAPNEKEKMRQNKQVMDTINRISNFYGGEAKIVLQINDDGQVVLNQLLTINPDELVNMNIVEEKPADTDATIRINYDFFYDLMSTLIKEAKGADIIRPYWEEKELGPEGPKIDDAVIMIRIFTSIIAGIFTGQVSVDPIFEAPRVIMTLGDLMSLASTQGV